MRQASKKMNTTPLSIHFAQRLREGVMIIVIALSLFLLMALISFHKGDPGWSNTGTTNHIANLGGRAGAWVADIFLFLFGYIAYLFPLMLAFSAWIFFHTAHERQEFDAKIFVMRICGFLLILLAGSGLASFQFYRFHEHLPYSSGGIIGNLIGFGFDNIFNPIATTLFLLALVCTGLTLFTGLSWLRVMEITGQLCLSFFGLFPKGFLLMKQSVANLFSSSGSKQSQEKIVDPEPLFKPNKNTRVEPKLNSIKISKRAAKDKQIPLLDESIEGVFPSLSLLETPESRTDIGYSNEQLEVMSREVELRLKDFGIEVHVVAVHPGPVITRFEMQLAPGIKASRITTLAKDLARSLSVVSVRIVEVIPGKPVVGLELPNEVREVVRLSEILSSQQYEQARSPLTLALGKDIAGNPVIVDLTKMPHLLIAGTTGAGKSVGINAMLLGLLYKSMPSDLRLILVDPKMLELSVYEGIPHLLTPVVTDMKEAANALRWCVAEMERRYRLMAAVGVRNLSGFNNKVREAIKKGNPILDPIWQGDPGEECPPLEPMPFIIVVIDEYADMMMMVGKKVEQLIARIAQKARAAGIHLILATQRPSVDVITGLIKANIPTRIAYQVSSKIDSRTVIDQAGAEQLLGYGDMLYLPPGTSVPVRVHGAYVDDNEIQKVAQDWKKRGEPDYIEEILAVSNGDSDGNENMFEESEADPLYDQAVYIVTKTRRASISSVQRRLKVGYNRAARMIEDMEAAGIVSPMESNGTREVLAPPPPEEIE